jgi:iron complex transport system ATP-binding protein
VSERRVAASTAFLGYAARLWSVVLTSAATGGHVPELAPDSLLWRQSDAGALALRITTTTGWQADDTATLAGLAYRIVVHEHVAPLADALRADAPIATGLLWGNAASALVGALRVLEGAAAPAIPASTAATTARAIAVDVLGRGRLADAGTVTASGAVTSFMRRSCCLFYRVPGGGLCGDCPLAVRGLPARRGRGGPGAP